MQVIMNRHETNLYQHTTLDCSIECCPHPLPRTHKYQGYTYTSKAERLNLDRETGDLTISKLSLNDTGVYERQRIGTYISSKQFKLEVYSKNHTHLPSSTVHENHKHTECQVECSVKNSRNLTLTWFKGNDWLQRMSSSDSAGLSLALNLNQRETHKYFCEARNPLENMTARFHPNEICLKNGESSTWCHSKLTVRPVLSTVIGLVLMVFVADHLEVDS
uniref:Ig-like domain-containing protein n=1 Tax=Neogobius melanostomus TaxID=47308 RepID=A0A8C6UFI4_9GOBI